MKLLLREYYRLTKPGIIYGNALTALAAFLYASDGSIDVVLLTALLLGLMASIAFACVLNNVLDRDIDLRMERTKERAIATGRVSQKSALIYAAILGILGFSLLLFGTSLAALVTTWAAVFVYVCLYTPLKRRSVHSTIVGAVAGAAPPVVGYVAVTHTLDVPAICLFLILVAWQMVHFFAIGIFRAEEYRAAGLPIMPVRFGIERTKQFIILYALLFCFAIYTFTVVAAPGPLYAWLMSLVSVGWVALSLSKPKDTVRWARTMFFYSLFALLAFCLSLAV